MTVIDRERVIRLLQEMAEYFRECRNTVSFASKEENHFWELQNAANAALELLKEQKALPIVYETNEYTGLPIVHCPSCGEYLEQFHSGVYGKETQFCYYCGQKVKWDG